MAFTPSPADILQLTYVIVNAEQVALPRIMLFVNSVGGAGGVTQGQIASAYGTPFATNILPTMNADSVFHGTMCQRILPAQRIAAESSITGAGPGTAAGGQTLPRQTALVISWLSQLAGRSFRGRMYMPFPSSINNVAGGFPSGAYHNSVQALANFLDATQIVTVGAQSTTLTPILLNRTTHTFSTILQGNAGNKWATVRRRGSFGRPNVPPF